MRRDMVVVNEGWGRIRLTEPCAMCEFRADGSAVVLQPVVDPATGETLRWERDADLPELPPDRWYARVLTGASAGTLVTVANHVCEPAA